MGMRLVIMAIQELQMIWILWIAIEPKVAEQMVSVLKEFGFNTPQLSKDIFLKESNVIRMGIAPIRIGILTTISGFSFDEVLRKGLLIK